MVFIGLSWVFRDFRGCHRFSRSHGFVWGLHESMCSWSVWVSVGHGCHRLVASTVFEFRARTRCGGRSGCPPRPPKFSRRLKVICAGYGRFGPKRRRKRRFAAGGHGFRGLAGLGRRGESLPSWGPGWGSFWRRQLRGHPRGSPPARVSSPVFGGFCAFFVFLEEFIFSFSGYVDTGREIFGVVHPELYRVVSVKDRRWGWQGRRSTRCWTLRWVGPS